MIFFITPVFKIKKKSANIKNGVSVVGVPDFIGSPQLALSDGFEELASPNCRDSCRTKRNFFNFKSG
jgi:hypothetical protein